MAGTRAHGQGDGLAPPPLSPRSRATVRSWLGGMLPGARERRVQVAAYATEWSGANDTARSQAGPCWVVLGDSTAQAIGASSIEHGYVGQVVAHLRQRDSRPWRVVNLSRTGALASEVLAAQLPALHRLGPVDLVSCAIGANDLLRRRSGTEAAMAGIAATLPPGALLANLPRGLREGRAALLNSTIADLAAAHDLRLVDLWAHTGPPWRNKFSGDGFHPNDAGYRDWAAAFIEALPEPA